MFPVLNILTSLFFLCSIVTTPPAQIKSIIENKPTTTTVINIFKDKNTDALEKMVRPWLLFYTNKYRVEHGRDTLHYDDCLLKAAGYHADYLFNETKDKHQYTLDHMESASSKWFKGKTPTDRASSAGCSKSCGENILFYTHNSLSAADFKDNNKINLEAKEIARSMVYDQWSKSPAHNENLLNKEYSVFGASVSIGRQASNQNYVDENSAPGKIVIFGTQVFAF